MKQDFIKIAHEINIYKYHCNICFIYIKHIIPDNDISILYFRQFGDFKTKIKTLYEKSYLLCHHCFKRFRFLNYKYKRCISEKEYLRYCIKYYPHFSLYNKFIFRHIEFQNKINKELIEYLYHPDRLKLRLDENSTDYLE